MSEGLYISKCLKLIEHKFDRGSSQYWTNGDFKILKKLIFEASSVNLSTYTLERLYGKLKTNKHYKPRTDTKDALALFLGYSDWEDFKNQNSVTSKKADHHTEIVLQDKKPETLTIEPVMEKTADSVLLNAKQKGKKNRIKYLGVLFLTLIIISVMMVSKYRASITPAVSRPVNFRAENPLGKPPHTTKFLHDLSGLEGNKFSIKLSQSIEKIKLLKSDKSSFTPALIPGWYTAYLLSDSTPVASTRFFVETSGWQVHWTMASPQEENSRWILPPTAVSSAGRLYTPHSFIPENIKRDFGYYFLSYYNIRNFNVKGDNLAFETRFRNNSKERESMCYDMWFTLMGTEGNLRMHFLSTGCAGFINMAFGEKVLDGHNQNLTPFGTDIQNWQKARMKVVNKFVHIYLNDKLIYKVKYTKSVGAIVGINIMSKTNGETDYVKLYNLERQLVYEDDFGGGVSD
ncbi:MAG TPA: hypothetical protein VGB63_10240 [Pedobacter sp.]